MLLAKRHSTRHAKLVLYSETFPFRWWHANFIFLIEWSKEERFLDWNQLDPSILSNVLFFPPHFCTLSPWPTLILTKNITPKTPKKLLGLDWCLPRGTWWRIPRAALGALQGGRLESGRSGGHGLRFVATARSGRWEDPGALGSWESKWWPGEWYFCFMFWDPGEGRLYFYKHSFFWFVCHLVFSSHPICLIIFSVSFILFFLPHPMLQSSFFVSCLRRPA